ncbi:MAG: alpha/beta hydrolase [Candidatus Margulisbacteria bacterium]|nr:alpha/beta hydrolase [Candidatus Margulisiibacteriota bacterium]
MDFITSFLCGLLAFNFLLEPLIEHQMVYHPSETIKETPEDYHLVYEDLYLKTADDCTIHGWYFPNAAADKVVLYFSGNAKNMSYNMDRIKLFLDCTANVMTIEYHGFGKSSGLPLEETLYIDARTAYQFLIAEKKFKPEQIIVAGRSLGGGVALELAKEQKVGGVILISSFTSIPAMADRFFPFYLRPFFWIKNNFNNLEKISDIHYPLLVIHSEKDTFVPVEMARKNFDKANEPKTFAIIHRGDHSQLYLQDVSPDIKSFLSEKKY